MLSQHATFFYSVYRYFFSFPQGPLHKKSQCKWLNTVFFICTVLLPPQEVHPFKFLPVHILVFLRANLLAVSLLWASTGTPPFSSTLAVAHSGDVF